MSLQFWLLRLFSGSIGTQLRFMRRSLKSPAVPLFTVVLLVLLATTLFSLRPMSAAIPDSVFFSLLHPGTGPQLNAHRSNDESCSNLSLKFRLRLALFSHQLRKKDW